MSLDMVLNYSYCLFHLLFPGPFSFKFVQTAFYRETFHIHIFVKLNEFFIQQKDNGSFVASSFLSIFLFYILFISMHNDEIFSRSLKFTKHI